MTYYAILYYQSTFGDRINIALVMFNEKDCFYEISEERLLRVKAFLPKGYGLFTMVVRNFLEAIRTTPNLRNCIDDLHRNSNNMFGISKSNRIDFDLTLENFDHLKNKILN